MRRATIAESHRLTDRQDSTFAATPDLEFQGPKSGYFWRFSTCLHADVHAGNTGRLCRGRGPLTCVHLASYLAGPGRGRRVPEGHERHAQEDGDDGRLVARVVKGEGQHLVQHQKGHDAAHRRQQALDGRLRQPRREEDGCTPTDLRRRGHGRSRTTRGGSSITREFQQQSFRSSMGRKTGTNTHILAPAFE